MSHLLANFSCVLIFIISILVKMDNVVRNAILFVLENLPMPSEYYNALHARIARDSGFIKIYKDM